MLHATTLSLPGTRFIKKSPYNPTLFSTMAKNFFPQWQKTFFHSFQRRNSAFPRFPYNSQLRKNCHFLLCPEKKIIKNEKNRRYGNIFLLYDLQRTVGQQEN